ncbi:DMT family transporter [Nesterenkonia sp. NBAIMH1]|uniref:EamA family transporter n=1 Tax=Nesterenkonia sp. NBAIMH1 TaxID=2600320 RepID=UPI001FEDBD69|nr:EamA family transporter [Nesterenkonia sp. NBAIMH1]
MSSGLQGRPGRGFTMIGTSAASTQAGAAIGSLAFPTLTPLGVVAARQVVAALVLNSLARPSLHRLTRAQWGPIALLAFFFAGMNTALYTAVDRIGLGMAVTIEFLGPLAVAIAASRRARDVGCAAIALLGVVLLTRPSPTSDFVGLGIALFAAVCWAGYILTNRVVGRRVPGLTGTAAATILSSVMTVPFAIGIVISVQPPLEAYLFAAAAGVLSTAVPYSLDLIVLRHISPLVFGLGMSLNPLFAALLGSVFLAEDLPLMAWAGIGLVVAANVLIMLSMHPPRLLRRRRPMDLQAGGTTLR